MKWSSAKVGGGGLPASTQILSDGAFQGDCNSSVSFNQDVDPAPGSVIRGQEIQGDKRVLIDWLQGTFPLSLPDGRSFSLIDYFEYLLDIKPSEWVELPRGMLGYLRAYRRGNITICVDGTEQMGQHLIVSGEGCRELEALGVSDWQGFLQLLRDLGFKPSRLDLALDDYQGGILDALIASVRSRTLVSPMRSISIVEQFGGKSGKTLYIGSRSGRLMIRVYDKAAQQGTDNVWERVELETRDERALAVFQLLCAGKPAGDLLRGVLARYVSPREDNGDPNRSRWPVAPWWASWLGAVSKLRLTLDAAVRTIQDVTNWLYKQVAPSLALLVEYFDGDISPVYRLISYGRARFKPKHLALLGGG